MAKKKGDMRTEHLVQDVKNTLLDAARKFGDRPWEAMSEFEQRAELQKMNSIAMKVVNDCLAQIASQKFPSAQMVIGKKVTFGGSIEVKGTLADSPDTLALVHDFAGETVHLVFATPKQFAVEDPETDTKTPGNQGTLLNDDMPQSNDPEGTDDMPEDDGVEIPEPAPGHDESGDPLAEGGESVDNPPSEQTLTERVEALGQPIDPSDPDAPPKNLRRGKTKPNKNKGQGDSAPAAEINSGDSAL